MTTTVGRMIVFTLIAVFAYLVILLLLDNIGKENARVPMQCVDITKQYTVAHYNVVVDCDEGACLKQETRIASPLRFSMRVNDEPIGTYRDLTGYYIDDYPPIDEPNVPESFEFQGYEQILFATTLAVFEDNSSKKSTHQKCFNLKQQKYHLLNN